MYVYETADNAEYDLLRAFADYNKRYPTDAERIMWDILKGKRIGHKFRRQHIIKDYIVDFVCLHHKLVIEIDGQYHLKGTQIVKDNSRTEDLQKAGFTVIRFTNDEVIGNPNGIIRKIKSAMMEIIHPNSSASSNKESATHDQKPAHTERDGNEVCSTPSPLEGDRGRLDAWAVDAACSGNPGPMEYQAIDLATGHQVFHFGPLHGTNNIGEFLAIVHALALCWQQGQHQRTIYSDSYNAILWVKKRKCKTTLEHTPQTEKLFEIIERAERWLQTHDYHNPIVKWETAQWGEIPADFGRK